MLSGIELAAALAAVFLGATAMGTVGFGLALVVAPVLLLFLEPQATVVTGNSLIAILTLFVVFNTRRHISLRLVAGVALGGLAGVPIGVLALGTANPVTLRITIAVLILVLAGLNLSNVRLPFYQHRLTGPVVGFLTTVSTTTLSIGGPLVGTFVMAQRWPPQVMRASLALFFLLANVLAIILYSSTGLMDRDTAANIGLLVPGVIVGFGLATLVARRMDQRLFRYTATALIVGGSCLVLGREIARL